MTLKLKTVAMIVMAVVMSCYPTKAASINMLANDDFDTEIPETVTFGVEITPYYYTVVIQDGVVQKIQLNGLEDPEFIIRTDFETAIEFVQNYNDMSWLEKVQFLVVRMQVPYHFIMQMAKGHMI